MGWNFFGDIFVKKYCLKKYFQGASWAGAKAKAATFLPNFLFWSFIYPKHKAISKKVCKLGCPSYFSSARFHHFWLNTRQIPFPQFATQISVLLNSKDYKLPYFFFRWSPTAPRYSLQSKEWIIWTNKIGSKIELWTRQLGAMLPILQSMSCNNYYQRQDELWTLHKQIHEKLLFVGGHTFGML